MSDVTMGILGWKGSPCDHEYVVVGGALRETGTGYIDEEYLWCRICGHQTTEIETGPEPETAK